MHLIHFTKNDIEGTFKLLFSIIITLQAGIMVKVVMNVFKK